MLTSMTGFGGDVYSDSNITIETEIKSLNSRFLDLNVRLPKELYSFEFFIRELVKSKVSRGKVSVNITLSQSKNGNQLVESLDIEALKSIYNLLKKIKEESNLTEEITLENITQFKDLFLSQDQVKIEVTEEILSKTLANSLNNLIEMRKSEGAELAKDLISRINIISEKLEDIENLASGATKDYFDKFKEKAKVLTEEFVDDNERFMIELGILSEKHDVTEECTRLKSHIKLFLETINSSSDAGRKLNFICQEMNREVNTINSKSISSEISHLGISIKEELEKIREQVQNIE